MDAHGELAEKGNGLLQRSKKMLLDWLFPPKCPFCRQLLWFGDQYYCRRCAQSIPWVREELQEQSFPHIKNCYSPLYYDGSVREALLRYKFSSLSCYAEPFSIIMSACIESKNVLLDDFDCVSWVPLSRQRLRKRGYDQARLLAEKIAKREGLPCRSLLQKRRNNAAQSGSGNAEKRRANVAGVYALKPGVDVSGMQILLIDDIVTTGATLSEAARVLRESGAREVHALTLARNRL